MNIIPISCGFDNYAYIVVSEMGNEAIIIDPAEAYPIMVGLEKLQLVPKAMFCTHHHNDHIGGIADLLDEFAGLPVWTHKSDKNRVTGNTDVTEDGQLITQSGLEIKVLHTPGHTDGSVCYLIGNHLFTGDTLFGAGCGRIFEGTARQMFTSLQRFATIERANSIHVWFGHEYTVANLKFACYVDPNNDKVQNRYLDAQQQRLRGMFTTGTTLSLEQVTNPFLRCNDAKMIAELHTASHCFTDDPVVVFRTLREMKDNFK